MVNFDHKSFSHQLPAFFPQLLSELKKEGFVPTLVGGAVRDFLMTGKTGHDWDVELSHETLAFNKTEWKELGKKFSKFGRTSFLPYDIIRLDAGDFQMEFSPPRIEHYHEDAKGHSNFTAEFNFKLPFEEAVKRRDFTINAMGIRFTGKSEYEFLDPLNGILHLRDQILHPAGPDFPKDPVRFLRAHRFKIKYQFEFSNELSSILEKMPLEGVTPSYLWSEMGKSKDPIAFLSSLLKALPGKEKFKLPVGEKFLLHREELRRVLSDSSKHESWLVALEWSGLSGEEWSQFFSLSSDTSRKIARWAATSKEFMKILPENFHGEFEEVRDRPEFEKVFDWYFTTKQLLQKNPELGLLKMIEEFLPHWLHLYRFEVIKEVKHIDPPYRAKYQVWNLCQRL